jgi:hypothetical protein
VPEAEPGQSAQDRFNEMLENPTCKGCHEYMNPLGYAFEHYDGIGSWRTEEGGSPIDAQGWIVGTQDINVDFDGAIELGEILGTSREVQECVATQWFRFGQKRLESEDDDCTVQSLQQAFVESGANILELMVSVTTTDAFRFRKLPDPEADPDAGGE